jgi:hypothetical protein
MMASRVGVVVSTMSTFYKNALHWLAGEGAGCEANGREDVHEIDDEAASLGCQVGG